MSGLFELNSYAYKHACTLHTCMHTCIQTYIQTYIQYMYAGHGKEQMCTNRRGKTGMYVCMYVYRRHICMHEVYMSLVGRKNEPNLKTKWHAYECVHSMYTYIHTYIQTNKHTYIHTHMHTHIHTYDHMMLSSTRSAFTEAQKKNCSHTPALEHKACDTCPKHLEYRYLRKNEKFWNSERMPYRKPLRKQQSKTPQQVHIVAVHIGQN